ncbi:pantoate--beta-alanine ligase [Roseixanthobacter glucoisosaccharinicivorans]|uniref:pantoate--beta-alanine ligase n=1 Tax=Roseixanthobacter glucoisosaccharinicivorans TaxID=3119923 RepID=UPI00372A7E0E
MAGKPEVVETVDALRARVAAWRAAGEKIALVPTMGALHEGHIALVRQAKALARRIVVSIFVNPTQFAPNEDFSRYPRTFENDVALLAAEDVDVVYAPTAADMYPPGFATHFAMGGPALGLETDFRTHFFAGVAIVVSKLLIRTGPDYAMFGEKDYQQLKVVTRLAADLDLPVEIIPGATVREHDGLALSSRNRYLSPEERAIAPVIQQALKEAAAAIRSGTHADSAAAAAADRIAAAGLKVDYVAARHAESLAPLSGPDEPVRLLAAAWLGKTRLIDNIGV